MGKSDLVKLLFLGGSIFSVGIGMATTLAGGLIAFGILVGIFALVNILSKYLDGDFE